MLAQRNKMLDFSFNFSLFLFIFLLNINDQVSARTCYECSSTFPASQICVPQCSQSFRANSSCFLKRDIPLEPDQLGSTRAGHIGEDPIIADAEEKYFLFGEEAVYKNPSALVGWDWEYGPITYACDSDGCNNPVNVNRLPEALNARIPNATLNQWLVSELDNSCYTCPQICITDDSTMTQVIQACTIDQCPGHACSFVARRQSTMGPATCDGGWEFTSSCLVTTEYPQVDMTLMYYIGSSRTVLYQMEAICLSDNCNNITTFQALKNAITVDPDLSCLPQPGASTSTLPPTGTTATPPTGTTTPPTGTTTTPPTGTTTTPPTGGPSTTTTNPGPTTTTPGGSPPTTTSDAMGMIWNVQPSLLLLFPLGLILFQQ